ncbi:MAG: TetR/AcrR family transcriptional regulator [Deltaproteobacteria bacterium]|nr:TetR/AcrR family transcriptional regulator [Deltaproteobacteria bacterium]
MRKPVPRPSSPGTAPVALGRRRVAQQDRSVETQRRLLAATARCLVDSGYARLTTAAIAREAQVSEGALFRHYPTKADLIVAAIEQVFADLESRYRRSIERAGKKDDVAAASVEALWKVMTTPEYLMTNEVYLAARSDGALGAALRPMALRHQANLLRRARELYGANAPPHFDDAFDVLILAMQAAAIDSVALQDKRTDRRRLAAFDALARLALKQTR